MESDAGLPRPGIVIVLVQGKQDDRLGVISRQGQGSRADCDTSGRIRAGPEQSSQLSLCQGLRIASISFIPAKLYTGHCERVMRIGNRHADRRTAICRIDRA